MVGVLLRPTYLQRLLPQQNLYCLAGKRKFLVGLGTPRSEKAEPSSVRYHQN